MLPCFVTVRRQSAPPRFRSSAPPVSPLFAKSANFPLFVFNHFCVLASSEKSSSPLFSYSCKLFCASKNHISSVFKRFRTLRKKPPGVGGYPLSFCLLFHGGTTGLFHLGFRFRNFLASQCLQFPPHHVRRKPCPQQAPIDGSHFLLINLPAIRPQLPLDPLADHGAFVVLLTRFL